jgi:hypothetical protein
MRIYASQSHDVRKDRLIDAGATFTGNLFLPRVFHRLRWYTRLGPGGTIAYVIARIALTVLLIRSMWKLARRQEEMWGEVREHLGREPTPDEVFEYFHPHEPD